jgi:hypothetical protein
MYRGSFENRDLGVEKQYYSGLAEEPTYIAVLVPVLRQRVCAYFMSRMSVVGTNDLTCRTASSQRDHLGGKHSNVTDASSNEI